MASKGRPGDRSKDPALKESLECMQELDELEIFYSADQAAIPISESFRNALKEKVWETLKNTHLIVFAATLVFFF